MFTLDLSASFRYSDGHALRRREIEFRCVLNLE